MVVPVVASNQCRGDDVRLLLRRTAQARQDDAAAGYSPEAEYDLAEIAVGRDEYALLSRRAIQHLWIVTLRRIGTDPGHIVAFAAQHIDDIARKILVGEKAHAVLHAKRVDAFASQSRARVVQAGADIVAIERRILFEDGVLIPAVSEPLDHELHGDPGASDDRFAHKYGGVEFDVLCPQVRLLDSPPGFGSDATPGITALAGGYSLAGSRIAFQAARPNPPSR